LNEDIPDQDLKTQARHAFTLILAKLGRRDHTEKELLTALGRKGYAEEAAREAALARARREGLVDDERLARGSLARMNARAAESAGRAGWWPRCARRALRAPPRPSRDEGGLRGRLKRLEASLLRFATRLLARAKGETPREKRIRVVRSLLTRGFELS
jgi:SOS response regulatory protein OraA/RecX